MKFGKYMTVPVLIAAMCVSWGCDEDENSLSEAVLASASSLNFEANGAGEKLITVYADADWVTEIPDWVTVTPASGSGTMDVTVTVTDNMRDGAEDNPRKANLVFKGRTLASRAAVLITQNGDKYRDVKEYSIGELLQLADETVVSVPEAIVMGVTTEGFIVTDARNTGVIYILNKTQVQVGDKVALKGTKSSDTQSLALVDCDTVEFLSTGGTVEYPAAKDITGEVDTFKSDKRDFISVSGILNGVNIAIEGATYSVNITNAPESMGVAALNGHRVTVTGYFAGVAAPVIRIMATDIQDNGVVKVIYYAEDFEWLDPWAVAGEAGRTVELDNLSAKAPQLPTPKVDGVSALDALIEKGYEFLRVTTKTPGECIYLQQNYIKFGKTSYQAGIVLPGLENVPEDVTTVLSFDWCPMRQTSGVVDPVNLIVIVDNGGNEAQFDIPESGFENGHKLEWIKAEVELTGVKITKDTKITIRQTQWPAATANRWFLDNIELRKAD